MNLVEHFRARAGPWFRPSDQLAVEDRNIRHLVIDTCWQGLMMGGAFTFISVFLVRLGASSLMVSLLTSLPAIMMVLFSIPAAQYIQRQRNLVQFTNRVRIFHRASFLLIALLPFFLHQGLVEVVVAVWAIKTIFISFIDSSWTVVVAEVIPPHRRASVNGGRWALLSIVTATAVAIYGYLLDRLPFPLGYQLIFLFSFVGGVAGMYNWGRLIVPEQPSLPATMVRAASLRKRLERYVETFAQSPHFLKYLLTTFVLRVGLNLPAALYSIYWIRHLDASDLWIGWQATAGKLALIVGYFLWGRVAMRKGHHLVLLICTLGVGLYPSLTGVVPSQYWLPLVAMVQGFFVTGIDLSFFNTLLQVCPSDRRPSFIAVNTVFAHLAMTLAPLLGSALAEWLDIRVVFWLAGGVHVVAALLFWLFRIAEDEH